MALGFGFRVRHLVDVFCSESIPCIEVGPVHCFLPCVLYWAECCLILIIDGILLTIDLMDVIDFFVGLSRIWIGILYKPVIMSLLPGNTFFSFLVTAMVCWLKLS